MVTISCGRNLRERVCVAEIRGDGREELATVTRPLTSATRPGGVNHEGLAASTKHTKHLESSWPSCLVA